MQKLGVWRQVHVLQANIVYSDADVGQKIGDRRLTADTRSYSVGHPTFGWIYPAC